MPDKTLTRKVGQRVLITGGRFHGAARIVKVNPVNILVQMEGGGRVNAHHTFLSDLADDAPVPNRFEATVEVALPNQAPGALVRLDGKPGVFVVLADKFERINCAPLGGDSGRYWRAPRATVTPVPADEVATILAVINS